jgi:hypothetical protein
MMSAAMDEYPGVYLTDRALAGLNRVDEMPPQLRACVHEFGLEIVSAFVQIGITEPRHIRHLVNVCWLGPRTTAQKTAGIESLINWLLVSSGSSMTAKTLVQALWRSQMVIVPVMLSENAIQASMNEVRFSDPKFTKHEKHRKRLLAAVRTAALHVWPHLKEQA